MYKVVEKFLSINGEGRSVGELAVFIRLAYCNLQCKYCDTKWANERDVSYTLMSKEDIGDYVKVSKAKRMTLTGGEPLVSEGIKELLNYLLEETEITIEIETNGSVAIDNLTQSQRVSFTLDYKGPSSLMEENMLMSNYDYLRKVDTVKFVVGTKEDLERAKSIIEKYKLLDKVVVFFSPSYDEIEAREIVEYMIENKLNDVKMQLQLHKYIWNPEQKGV